MKLYVVLCHEQDALNQLVVANSASELFNKLKSMYDITALQFEELLIAKSVNISYSQGGAQPQIYKDVNISLDSTQL